MNFSVENEQVFCHCRDNFNKNSNYTGLISNESAQSKFHKYQKKKNIDQKQKDKKVSLKAKNKSVNFVSQQKNQEVMFEWVDQSLKSQGKMKSRSITQNEVKSTHQAKIENLNQMQKLKSGIQIPLIPTPSARSIYHQDPEYLAKFKQFQPNNSDRNQLQKKNLMQQKIQGNLQFHQQPNLKKYINKFNQVSFPQKASTQNLRKIPAPKIYSQKSLKMMLNIRSSEEQQPLKIEKQFIPKEIQSIIDEDEEDNTSEVLGFGVNEFLLEKDDCFLPKKTTLTTTTNDRNSQIKNSPNFKIDSYN